MNILKEERVLNPIITWNGYIVDGHDCAETSSMIAQKCTPNQRNETVRVETVRVETVRV